jgi:uncharacterized protein
MKFSTFVTILVVLIAIIISVLYLAAHTTDQTNNTKDDNYTRVDFLHPGDTSDTVYVEVADNEQSQEKGLMFRTSLDYDKGMLFVFDHETRESFWMENTPLPLDMVFVDGNLNIIDINHNASPNSTDVFTSSGPCKYVVEVNGGYCKEQNISIGDKIKIS